MSLKGMNLSGGKGNRGRVKDDYYATPPEDIRIFLDRLKKRWIRIKW